MFQFQTGAIKSTGSIKGARCQVWFQFQTGAIKRGCRCSATTQHSRFNSKLVRLKVHP